MANSGGVIVCLIIMICCVAPSLATVYTVGDSAGWALNVDYSTWASGKTFNVGDSLVFNYGSSHNVDEVSSSDYSTCTAGNSITTDNSGSTTIPLTTAGTHYFICGVIGHCGGGMKMAVTVAGGATATPSGTSTSSDTGSGSTTTSLAPPSVITTPTGNVPEASSTTTLSPFVAAFFTWVGLLFKMVL